jgi:queuine/archaeosine tRNA-ribosyltransferase
LARAAGTSFLTALPFSGIIHLVLGPHHERSLPIAGQTLPLPCFFPSVSSVKANQRPVEYVELLVALREPQLLISAYDFHKAVPADRKRMARSLGRATKQGTAILLDSGNYEGFWHRDRSWKLASFLRELRRIPFHLAFAFDDQDPPTQSMAAVGAIEKMVLKAQRTMGMADGGTVVPIVHGTPAVLAKRAAMVAERLQPIMLAVPERSLGAGLLARAHTVRAIRTAIDKVAPSCVLHLLGTGNPLSLLVLSLAGAQSFDGLEWCRTCADPDTARLYHFQQRSLVGRTDQDDLVSSLSSRSYEQGTLVHNLLFFRSWMGRIRQALAEGKADEMVRQYVASDRADRVLKALHGAP